MLVVKRWSAFDPNRRGNHHTSLRKMREIVFWSGKPGVIVVPDSPFGEAGVCIPAFENIGGLVSSRKALRGALVLFSYVARYCLGPSEIALFLVVN